MALSEKPATTEDEGDAVGDGSRYVGLGMRIGWRGPIKHYSFNCSTHGLVVDYPHG